MNKSFRHIVSPGNVMTVDAVLELITRSLYQINSNLALHCERTAFLSVELLRAMGKTDRILLQKVYLLAIFHTIGFFRHDPTNIGKAMAVPDEIFGNPSLSEDCFWYSQCYIKNMTPLGDFCELLKMHHTPYNENLKLIIENYEVSNIFFFASRIAAWTLSKDHNENIILYDRNAVEHLVSPYCSKEVIEAFLSANKDNYLLKSIYTNSFLFKNKLFQQVIDLSDDEKFELVKLLIYIMDLKSTFTLNHIIKTSCYALSIASRMNLDSEDLNIVFMGALLHDIGKLKTPSMILESASRLEYGEMNIMRAHVNHTKKILQGIIPKKILDNACHHHEKLNGKGYPLGLKAENLSTIDRILAVSDVASALSEKRSYKSEFTREQVIEILTDMGVKNELDSDIVSVLCSNYDEIREEIPAITGIMSTNFGMVMVDYYSTIDDAAEEIEAVIEEL